MVERQYYDRRMERLSSIVALKQQNYALNSRPRCVSF
jgi:hypothetical protein